MFELFKELMPPMTKSTYIKDYDDLTAPPDTKEEYSPPPEYNDFLNSLFMEPDPEPKHEPPKVKQQELIFAVVRKERKDYKVINQVNNNIDKKKKKRRKRKKFVLTLKRSSKYRKNQNKKNSQTSQKIAITKKPREIDTKRKNKKR